MAPRIAGSVLVGLALVLGLVGCTSQAGDGSASESYPIVTGPTADDSGLVAARHPQCNEGAAILHYLATGDNGGDPAMDQVFANDVGVPVPQARALADKWITSCDQRYAAQAAAASSSAAQAQAEASYEAAASASAAAASASEAVVAAEERRSCAAIGGQATDHNCQSASQGNAANDPYYPCSAVYVEFTDQGSIDQGSLSAVNTDHPGCFR